MRKNLQKFWGKNIYKIRLTSFSSYVISTTINLCWTEALLSCGIKELYISKIEMVQFSKTVFPPFIFSETEYIIILRLC